MNVGEKKVTSSIFKELANIIIICITYVMLTDKLIISQVFVDDLAKWGVLIVGFHEAINSFLRSFKRGNLTIYPYQGKGEANLNSGLRSRWILSSKTMSAKFLKRVCDPKYLEWWLKFLKRKSSIVIS